MKKPANGEGSIKCAGSLSQSFPGGDGWNRWVGLHCKSIKISPGLMKRTIRERAFYIKSPLMIKTLLNFLFRCVGWRTTNGREVDGSGNGNVIASGAVKTDSGLLPKSYLCAESTGGHSGIAESRGAVLYGREASYLL